MTRLGPLEWIRLRLYTVVLWRVQSLSITSLSGSYCWPSPPF